MIPENIMKYYVQFMSVKHKQTIPEVVMFPRYRILSANNVFYYANKNNNWAYLKPHT